MKTVGRICLAMMLLTTQPVAAEPAADDRASLHWIRQEVEIAGALDNLSRLAVSAPVVFTHVAIVDPESGGTLADQTVAVRDGKIAWTGDASAAPDMTGFTAIDGRGLVLSPGLVDMHVHTMSLAEQLLRLATGTTAVREMDGFPWMLELRRAIIGGTLLAPTAYIAGTIITSYPLDGYSVVVHTPEEARATVRSEAVCGYDFIKVHNILKLPLFDAVADEARRAGLDLVGHIPHDITIDHAVHAGGMRTLEHLKGFINDGTLIVSGEDYAKAVAGADVWLTPTFYTMTGTHRAVDAQNLLALPEMSYVPLRKRRSWAGPVDAHDLKGQALIDVAIPAAMARLLPLHPHWLAGTDAAQYPLQVAGYALLDELIDMEQFGIPRADVLRAATTEPAAALHRPGEFGRIATGMRADLILLRADPTRDLRAYRNNLGVMVRGHWLSRAALDAALARLAQIQAEPDEAFAVNGRSADALVADLQKLAGRHIALDAMHLEAASASLARLGYKRDATQLEGIMTALQAGACHEITPPGGG
ncbi:MAG TPA: amidohydrolase family protein [Rhizomicrobium sp.]|jgi:hypothetical protein